MAIFARNFAGSDLPPPAAILHALADGDQDRAIVSNPTVRSEPNLQDKCPIPSKTHRDFRIENWRSWALQVPPRILDSLQAPPSESQVSRGVGYPALRQAPYVALVVPAYGEIL
ncbi:hypothetical protein L3X38_011205 [Prunus dulcis]|uniref:Uncharacterized protein n=1 Tax=Prunus dulcis TaxID=3755 RepID=A0AAD4ZEX7_PRUDU|nr:hypothetical protein L3X38_011205 [Prunus dulcis]